MGYYIGCDLGGTNMRAAIVDSTTGKASYLTIVPTLAHEGHLRVLERMTELFNHLIEKTSFSKDRIEGIGIGIPGMLDVHRGFTNFATNLPGHWIDVAVAPFIQSELGIPAFILNDVRSITWGELKFGAGKGCHSLVLYAIGTGVGGGVVIDNELVLGNSGQAGEVGHMTVVPEGFLCNCGNRGCLEQYASGPAIRAAAMKAIAHGATTILGDLVSYDLNKMTPKIVSEAALKNDAIAIDILNQAGYYLGLAISNSIAQLEPQRIVIGGGIAQAGDLLLNPIRETIRKTVQLAPLDKLDIVLAQLGDNAGVIGASLWAEHQVLRKHQ